MKRAFTLVEMMIAIALLSIILLFLYQSLSTLRQGNTRYAIKLQDDARQQQLLRTIYLDLLLSDPQSVKIENDSKTFDRITMQTDHSIYGQIHPYVTYYANDYGLFRMESYEALPFPLTRDAEMLIDDMGEFDRFRVYQSKAAFLVDMQKRGNPRDVFKVEGLH